MAYSVYVSAKSTINVVATINRYTPPVALPPMHVTQVEMVKKIVPKGSLLFYYMPQPEPWQFGLWKRSLYPDYVVLPVVGLKQLASPQVQTIRRRHDVRYVLIEGAPLDGVNHPMKLPDYMHGKPMTLAELGN